MTDIEKPHSPQARRRAANACMRRPSDPTSGAGAGSSFPRCAMIGRAIWIVFIWIALTSQVNATSSIAMPRTHPEYFQLARGTRPGSVSNKCGLEALQDILVRNMKWPDSAEYKREHVYMGPREWRESEIRQLKEAVGQKLPDDLAKKIRSLDNDRRKNFLLVFQEINKHADCAFLISAKGILASEYVEGAATKMDKLAATMEVLTLRGRRVVRARQNGNCKNDTSYGEKKDEVVTTHAALKQSGARKKEDERAARRVEKTEVALRELSRTVLPGAIRRTLAEAPGVNRLLLILSPNLSQVPFLGLPLVSGALVEHFESVTLGSVKDVMKGEANIVLPNNEEEALIVGNPSLKWDGERCFEGLERSEPEVRDVARQLKLSGASGYFVEEKASFDNVHKFLVDHQKTLKLVYFSTHGVADSDNPADESILALNKRHLAAKNLRELVLKSKPLIVLSACETGLGKNFRDGVFGMATLWNQAGAPQVVESLWDVDDNAAATLLPKMISLMADRKTQSETALRLAILDYRKTDKDPTNWASFTVFGRPGGIVGTDENYTATEESLVIDHCADRRREYDKAVAGKKCAETCTLFCRNEADIFRGCAGYADLSCK